MSCARCCLTDSVRVPFPPTQPTHNHNLKSHDTRQDVLERITVCARVLLDPESLALVRDTLLSKCRESFAAFLKFKNGALQQCVPFVCVWVGGAMPPLVVPFHSVPSY